jgi:fructuronate reductase
MPRPLNRNTFAADPPARVRIAHIGLGAFHRAHQAWYTDKVDAKREWGIAAFTGRSPRAAETLSAQDGLYTLIERSGKGDQTQIIQSIVAAHDGADLQALSGLVTAPTTAIVTITVTEAAYHVAAVLTLYLRAKIVTADLAKLRASWSEDKGFTLADSIPESMAARLAVALDARRRAGAGAIAVVSCDNLSANGRAARNAIVGTAAAVDPSLAVWIEENVSFVSTSVDRISPRTTVAVIARVAEQTGFDDKSPVVTEPFHSWVLSGAFPAGRPEWEKAGAVFVDDIEPFERRKLWLLNGAHSLLAYAGQLRGHKTVAEAIADQQCAEWVESLWDEAQRHLTQPELQIGDYRAALLNRFANARIAHHLAQIAIDGTSKLRMRAVAILCAERAVGRDGAAAARVIAAWIDFLHTAAEIKDAFATQIRDALAKPAVRQTAALLTLLEEELSRDEQIVNLIDSLRGSFTQKK